MQDLTSHLQQNDSDYFSKFILFLSKINHNNTCREYANVENVHTWIHNKLF